LGVDQFGKEVAIVRRRHFALADAKARFEVLARRGGSRRPERPTSGEPLSG
jgi:hypothetical protein